MVGCGVDGKAVVVKAAGLCPCQDDEVKGRPVKRRKRLVAVVIVFMGITRPRPPDMGTGQQRKRSHYQ